jgi:fucose permease
MIATFVAYTAAESGPIAWGYTYLISDRQASHTLAAIAMASFWAALTVGRFGLAVMDRRVAGTSILEASCLLMIAGTGLFWILPGSWAIAGLPIAGLGAAAVFPMLVALVPARMGEAATGRAVGASIAAASLAGPAAVALFGVLAAHLGLGVLGVCLFLSCVVLYALNRVLTLASAEGAT